MKITITVNSLTMAELQEILNKVAEIRAELVKKYPDIVVNVEAEVGSK